MSESLINYYDDDDEYSYLLKSSRKGKVTV